MGELRAFRKQTLTIPTGATTSSVCKADGYTLFGLQVPSAMTGTAITFQVSADDSTYQALYSLTNTQVSLTIAVSRSYLLPSELSPWPFFKIVSGSTELADRSFVVSAKG